MGLFFQLLYFLRPPGSQTRRLGLAGAFIVMICALLQTEFLLFISQGVIAGVIGVQHKRPYRG